MHQKDLQMKETNVSQPPKPTLNVGVTVLLKYLSNFQRPLYLPLINYEIELDISQTKDCVLIEQNINMAGVNFAIASTKIYVPVVYQ